MQTSEQLDRREALKRLTVLAGGFVSLSTAGGILGGCRVGPSSETFVPQVLTADQNAVVSAMSELIIPTTDTPGAAGARVNEYIDKMLADWYGDDVRDRFLGGLAEVDDRAKQSFGKSFVDGTADEQNGLLSALESERVAWRDASRDDDSRAVPPFFQMMREMTIAGYYTSEIGAAQELNNQIVFARFEGSVPYAEIGKAWS